MGFTRNFGRCKVTITPECKEEGGWTINAFQATYQISSDGAVSIKVSECETPQSTDGQGLEPMSGASLSCSTVGMLLGAQAHPRNRKVNEEPVRSSKDEEDLEEEEKGEGKEKIDRRSSRVSNSGKRSTKTPAEGTIISYPDSIAWLRGNSDSNVSHHPLVRNRSGIPNNCVPGPAPPPGLPFCIKKSTSAGAPQKKGTNSWNTWRKDEEKVKEWTSNTRSYTTGWNKSSAYWNSSWNKNKYDERKWDWWTNKPRKDYAPNSNGGARGGISGSSKGGVSGSARGGVSGSAKGAVSEGTGGGASGDARGGVSESTIEGDVKVTPSPAPYTTAHRQVLWIPMRISTSQLLGRNA